MKMVALLALAASAPARAESVEKLRGTIVVVGDLYATKEAARGGNATLSRDFAVTVVKDHGDVVEVTTKLRGPDCVPAWDGPFELTAFVRRDALVRRTSEELVRTFADGTMIAIDRGALVDAKGSWDDPVLASTGIAPPATQYSLPQYTAATLSPPTGQRVECGPPPSTCAVSTRGVKQPLVDGQPIDASRSRSIGTPYRDGGVVRVDVQTTCARLRVQVDPSLLSNDSGGAVRVGNNSSTRRVRTYLTLPGPVTWSSGKPAGTAIDYKRYDEDQVQEVKGRYCVAVARVADRVCFRKKDVEVSRE